jgi:hypothetical protein
MVHCGNRRLQGHDEFRCRRPAMGYAAAAHALMRGEIDMEFNAPGQRSFGWLLVASLLASAVPSPARAEFFNDVRRTFQTDIPHFFQDDIPCAFGGEPTSHTKTSCKSGKRPVPSAAEKDRAAVQNEQNAVQQQNPNAPKDGKRPIYRY